MRILVTGADGFIGRNLVSSLRLDSSNEIFTYTRDDNPNELEHHLREADFVYHLAGVNRPKDERAFEINNFELTQQIVDTLQAIDRRIPLVFASSRQASLDNPYGRSKLAAEHALLRWRQDYGGEIQIYRLPGVFGKWSRPNYNSVVATFCHNIQRGLPIEIRDPSALLELTYIDDVIDDFTRHLNDDTFWDKPYSETSKAYTLTLEELSSRLTAIHAVRKSGVVPNLGEELNQKLLATYTSFLAHDNLSYELTTSRDNRGDLSEIIKSEHFGQVFVSTTIPGESRGNHWHQTKVEKFLVVHGDAEISFRGLDPESEVFRYRVTGSERRVLDIPVGLAHSIKNVGKEPLITLFWASEIFNPDAPDTFFEMVEQ